MTEYICAKRATPLPVGSCSASGQLNASVGCAKARPALPRSWAIFQASLPDSNETLCTLNRQRELTLPRLTAAPTATKSAWF